MFDLIQQNMGNGLGLQFMTEAILLILAFFGIKEAIRRNERRRLENKVSWFFEQRLKWISSKLNRQRIARRRAFAKNWKKFQSSDVSPSGHRGWQFGWNKDYDLLARIKTVSGEMTMIITHIDTVIMGNVFHGQDELANSIVKDFVKDDKMLAAHLATAQLIKSANEFISRLEKPQPITRWLDPKTPDGFDATLTERDPLKETAPARFYGGRDSFWIKDDKEAKEYLAAHETDIMKSGYKIKDGCIFCPHPQYSPEATQFKMKAYPKLTKAGIPAGYLKFSFPDREAVAEPCSSPRSEMFAMIQTHLHQQDLKSMKNVTGDNCVECPYEEGSTEAKLFTEIVRGRALSYGVNFTFTYPSSVIPFSGKKRTMEPTQSDLDHYRSMINCDLKELGMTLMTEMPSDYCVACPYPKGTALADRFEGIVCKRLKVWLIQPTFTYDDTDVPTILERGEKVLTSETTPAIKRMQQSVTGQKGAIPSDVLRQEMIDAIGKMTHSSDLSSMTGITDDNCVGCEYKQGSPMAREFEILVKQVMRPYNIIPTFSYGDKEGPSRQEQLERSVSASALARLQTDEVILAQSDSHQIPDPVANTNKLVGQPPEDEENAFILKLLLDEGFKVIHDGGMSFVLGLKHGRFDYKIMINLGGDVNRTQSPTWLVASATAKANSGTDSHEVLLKQQKNLTADTPLRPCILSFALTMSEAIDSHMESPEANTEPHPIDIKPDGDDTPPVLRVFNAGVKNAWDWQQIPNKVAGRIIFLKEVQGHHYIIVLDSVVCHESDADEDGNLLLVMATILIANEKWDDFAELRRLWQVEELIGKDDDIDGCHNNLCYALENIAKQINGALDGNLTEFCASLTCPFEDATDEQIAVQNKITMQVISNGDFTPPTADGTDGGAE